MLIMFNADDFDLIIQFPDRKKKKWKWIFKWKWISEIRTSHFSIASCLLSILTHFILYFKTREKLAKSKCLCNTSSAAFTIFYFFLRLPRPQRNHKLIVRLFFWLWIDNDTQILSLMVAFSRTFSIWKKCW